MTTDGTLEGLARNPAIPADLLDLLVRHADAPLWELAGRDDLTPAQRRLLVARGRVPGRPRPGPLPGTVARLRRRRRIPRSARRSQRARSTALTEGGGGRRREPGTAPSAMRRLFTPPAANGVPGIMTDHVGLLRRILRLALTGSNPEYPPGPDPASI
ncbi:hypothetical protein ABZ807_15375 [Micromonospora sp. NPDC047548]|uniref:hypothetical protein n=1 Tax=Micromonospora sp. NPDC047548 TaxID=3155624 RepID=UPI0033D02847